MSRAVERPQRLPLILFFVGYNAGGGKRLSVCSVTSSCASLSVPAEESKGWSATIFYLLHSLIGKPKLILQIKNKPLTVSLLHSQSRPRGSKLHYILGRIYARIYPLDIEFISCYNMCSGYIASSLKCYHFRTCEGGKPPFNPPFKRADRLIMRWCYHRESEVSMDKKYIENQYRLAVLDFQTARNEDEQWEARKTMARLEQIAAQEYGFEYADELHEKEIGRKGL